MFYDHFQEKKTHRINGDFHIIIKRLFFSKILAER